MTNIAQHFTAEEMQNPVTLQSIKLAGKNIKWSKADIIGWGFILFFGGYILSLVLELI